MSIFKLLAKANKQMNERQRKQANKQTNAKESKQTNE
jgi:hypothetical protein